MPNLVSAIRDVVTELETLHTASPRLRSAVAPFRPRDVIQIRESVPVHANRKGVVATVRRVNPLRRSVVVGTKQVERNVGGRNCIVTVDVTEERPLPPVYEIGVDLAGAKSDAALSVSLWFRPDEVAPTGRRSHRRTAAEIAAAS